MSHTYSTNYQNRQQRTDNNTGLTGQVRNYASNNAYSQERRVSGRGTSSPGHQKIFGQQKPLNLSPERNQVDNRRQTEKQQQTSDQSHPKAVCPPAILALIGLIGIAGLVLGILFGFGIINGETDPFDREQYANTVLVNQQRYFNSSITILTTVINTTQKSNGEKTNGKTEGNQSSSETPTPKNTNTTAQEPKNENSQPSSEKPVEQQPPKPSNTTTSSGGDWKASEAESKTERALLPPSTSNKKGEQINYNTNKNVTTITK